jgi:hypothetical protein
MYGKKNSSKKKNYSDYEIIDKLFDLINNFLNKKKNIENKEYCHQALGYMDQGIQQIKDCQDLKRIAHFESKWLKLKKRIKPNSEPATFRLAEIAIKKEIAACKKNTLAYINE